MKNLFNPIYKGPQCMSPRVYTQISKEQSRLKHDVTEPQNPCHFGSASRHQISKPFKIYVDSYEIDLKDQGNVGDT